MNNGDAKPVNQVKEFYDECTNVGKLRYRKQIITLSHSAPYGMF
jgi:hypothetical protein